MLHAIPIISAWFRQDGANPHTNNAVLRFLRDVFEERVSFNRYPALLQEGFSWPPTLPDLNPSDYFLWGVFELQCVSEKITHNSGSENRHTIKDLRHFNRN
jgi:hypothetical protein